MEKNVLQMNGKAYDAVTGRRIDGLVPPKKATLKAAATSASPAASKVSAKARQTNHAAYRQPQHAQTLMRRAVKKPTTGLKKQLHVHQAISHAPAQTIAVKHVASHVDSTRLRRAESTEKHAQVSRFNPPSVVPVTFTAVPVKHAPQDIPGTEPPTPVVPPPTPTNTPPDIFEQAIANATHFVDVAEHKTHFKKKARRHALTMTAGVFALLMLGSFLTYQNTPTLQVKVAGVVAGVSTRMPDFKAAGFSYEGVSGSGTKVVYRFKSSLAHYQLIEQTTNWTGQEMIDQVSSVAANGTPNYTILTVGKRTVYKFNDRHATWVANGTWYQVHGSQPLSDSQLTALVQNS